MLRGIIQWLKWRERTSVTESAPSKECSAVPTVDDITRIVANARDEDDVDQINRAITEYGRASAGSASSTLDALTDRFLKRLPNRDYQILCHFKRGRNHAEIAALMNIDVEAVRQSLVKTYFSLRWATESSPDPGGGESEEVAESSPPAMERKLA